MSSHLASIRVVAIGLVLAGGSLPLVETTEAQASSQSRDQKTIADFQKRMSDYVALHKKIESSLPKLPDRATPEQIDKNQRAFGQLLIEARANAKQGDLFGPDMAALVRRALAPLFRGAQGAGLRAAISEEPHPVVPRVNTRYPDEVPLSTMPPVVLKALPPLEEEIEYRFIGRHLILLDSHSHLIADVMVNAMPA
ncbi:MAG TPA: hypothetical protein VN700_03460 [Vicinamibacterales bacterium]|nr:hypothetical protein [Vicinamibacterales bacterium]